jgi:hypothetical protein
MTVAELIEALKLYPQDAQVITERLSEYCYLLTPDGIELCEACEPNADGWVPGNLPDKPTRTYLRL